jgi:hypothetical protein
VYVGPKKVTRYATNRRERPGKAHLPLQVPARKSAPARREPARFTRPESLITISKGAAPELDGASASV